MTRSNAPHAVSDQISETPLAAQRLLEGNALQPRGLFNTLALSTLLHIQLLTVETFVLPYENAANHCNIASALLFLLGVRSVVTESKHRGESQPSDADVHGLVVVWAPGCFPGVRADPESTAFENCRGTLKVWNLQVS